MCQHLRLVCALRPVQAAWCPVSSSSSSAVNLSVPANTVGVCPVPGARCLVNGARCPVTGDRCPVMVMEMVSVTVTVQVMEMTGRCPVPGAR